MTEIQTNIHISFKLLKIILTYNLFTITKCISISETKLKLDIQNDT